MCVVDLTTHIIFSAMSSDIQKLAAAFKKKLRENPGGGVTAKGLMEAALAAGVTDEGDIVHAMKCIGVKPDKACEEMFQKMRESTQVGNNVLRTGEVVGVNYMARTLDVKIKDTVVKGCLYVAGTMATFFGIENTSLPAMGATVLLYYSTNTAPSLVLGTLGGQNLVVEALQDSISGQYTEDDYTTSATKGLKATLKGDKYVNLGKGAPIPMDLVAGEMNLTMSTGTMIRLLHNFAQLGASEAAKVEACVLNDMVRIVDNYFAHHSCGGDELIWGAGGGCTKESHFTGYGFEAEGKVKPDDALCPEKEQGIYDLKKDLKSVTGDTGRWRLSEYTGFLGDMVHRWVTDPTEVASNIMDKALRAGQFRSWIGSDGTYCVQAAGGIQLEVTQYIVIPTILKAWNDPDFDLADAMTKLDNEFLTIWGKGPRWDDLKVACWQLQYYTKYLTLWHSLANFRRLAKHDYCKIPKEAHIPLRTPMASEADKYATNPLGGFRQPGHALISMDPSGNMSLRSNDHTSITMHNGNMQIACPGNLELKAGGIVSMQGNTISIRGAQRVEITSIFGTLVTTARTAWKALCELGTIWLKGDGSEDTELPKNKLQENVDKLGQEPREFAKFAVVIDSSRGKTLIHGHQGVVLNSKEKQGHIMIQTDGPESHINMHATEDIRMLCGRRIFMKAKAFIARITDGIYFLKSKALNFLDMLTIQEGAVHVNQLKGNTISAYQTFLGRQDNVTKLDQETLDEYYVPNLATAELAAADKGEDEENAFEKKADAVLSEQMKMKFKTSFDWDKLYKEFSAGDMVNCIYEAPFESLAKCVEGEPQVPYVRIKASEVQEMKSSVKPKPAPRNILRTYPQKYNKQTTSVKKEDKDILLGAKPWENDFTKDDIKGIKDMSSEEYVYTFSMPPKTN